MGLRKLFVVSGVAVAASAVVFAAAAFACTALATLESSTAATPAGSEISATGTSFAAQGAGPVVIHWNGAAGPEVGRATPDAEGRISTPIAVPKTADPGQYVLVATQTKEGGDPVYGTPARATVGVTGADGTVPVATPGALSAPVQPGGGGDGNGVVALTLVLGAAGLALFGAGFASVVRHGRRPQPQSAAVRHD
ncbi:MAG TPA: hypothetical protein VHM89_01200 [Acidimicrobiales bacterium]|nr:hypothetical protein [Acidimicrobiales bacterium]